MIERIDWGNGGLIAVLRELAHSARDVEFSVTETHNDAYMIQATRAGRTVSVILERSLLRRMPLRREKSFAAIEERFQLLMTYLQPAPKPRFRIATRSPRRHAFAP